VQNANYIFWMSANSCAYVIPLDKGFHAK
jgi:hypothetical protein